MGNLYKEKLKGKTMGIFFATGAPLHLGHYSAIMRAKRENDMCLVVISGRKGDRGDAIGLDLNRRFRYTRELFADDENIYVAELNEDAIPSYPDGWVSWLAEVNKRVLEATVKAPERITWYVGEPKYKEELLSFTEDSVVLLDRKINTISATMIRENPFKYWNAITRPFRRHFSTNVLVMGTASGGKTTLVRDLARSFGSSFTTEYAREYEEDYNVRDEELTANDFHYLASGQFDNNKKTIMNPSNNGLFFADTNVLITQMYSELYLSKEEHAALTPFYDIMLKKEKWDLILVVPPVTKYVDDGFRDMRYSEDKERWDMHNKMMKMVEEQGWMDKVVILDAPFDKESNSDNKGFYARYDQARETVATLMNEKFGVFLV